MIYIISDAELAASRVRYAQRQVKQSAPSAPPPTLPPGFVYQPRTQAQWHRRAHQSKENYTTPVMVEPDPVIEDDGEDTEGGELKSKVSSTTLCLCEHPKKDHHCTPESHGSDHAYYCITSHCAVYSFKDGVSAPCDCRHFRVNETDASKFTKPRAGPYDLCATCGHFKILHCTKAKPGKVDRLKPGELAYRIMTAPSGMSYGCKHFSLTDSACQCISTSCSASPDGKNFCECEAFQNPWSVRKTRVPRKKKATAEPVDASPAVAATDSTPETVPAKPRKKRVKKTAITGETLFPPSIQPD